MRRLFALLLVTSVLVAIPAGSAVGHASGEAVDQIFETSSGSVSTLSGARSLAQTFVPAEDTLSSVDLYLSRQEELGDADLALDDLDDLFLLTYIFRQADDAQAYCSLVFTRYAEEEAFFAIVVGWFAKYRFVESLEDPDALYNGIASRTEVRCRSVDIEGRFSPSAGETVWKDAGEDG